MKPVTYDFDVITDTAKPQRRAPEPTEKTSQPDAEEQRRSAAPPQQKERIKVHAAE